MQSQRRRLWHFPACRLTNPQSILFSSGRTERRNMFLHSECFRLHDKPLSSSSPCLRGYLKRTAGATTKAQDGLTFRLPGIKIEEAQRTKESHPPIPRWCWSACVEEACWCFHRSCRYVCSPPCWERDGLAREQITCHVRYKWHRTFYTALFILTEWEQPENSWCFHSAVQGWWRTRVGLTTDQCFSMFVLSCLFVCALIFPPYLWWILVIE